MKNLKFKLSRSILFIIGLYFLTSNIKAQVQPLTVYIAGNDVNNLVPFIRRISITTPCGPGVREITTDILGKKIREIELCNGKRCGVTKIYKAGVLVKEINYFNDYVISYKSFNNGILVTEINADRSRVVAQGALVPLNWKRIYVKYNRHRIAMVSKRTFIDNLLKFQVPENVATILKDINNKSMNGVAGSEAIFNCDESFSKVNDSNVKLQGTSSTEKSTAKSFINNLGSTCSQLTRGKINDDFNGLKGDAAKEERKRKAMSQLDNMISACRNRANAPGMFENPIIIGAIIVGETVLDGAVVAEAATLTAEGAAVITELAGAAIIEATVVDGAATALTTEVAGTVVSQGAKTVLKTAIETSIRSLPSLTESAEAVAASDITTVGVARFVMTISAAAVALGVTPANATEPPMEICEVETDANNDSNGQTMVDANQGQTPVPQNPSAGSTTPDEAAGNNCERLVRFRDYCNNNGWQTLECQDAMGILTGCGTTDPRIVYVSPQGEPTGSGCYDVSKAQAAALECKKRSLIASYINGNNMCSSKGAYDLKSLVRDVGNIDPSPIDGKLYHNSFTQIFKGTKISLMEGLTLKQLQSKLPLPVVQNLVVFMDADCPASRSFAKILASKEINDAIPKGVNIIVVDVAADPAITNNYNILGYPTTFLMNSTGKLSLPMLGALTVQETVTSMLSK